MSIPTLRQNGNSVYEVHWTERGRSRRVSTRTRDLAAAKAFLGAWLLAEREAPAGAENVFTVAELWTAYDERHVRRNVASPETLGYCWKNLALHFGRLKPSEITQSTVDAYERARAAGRIGKKSGASTVRRELVALRSCLNWCAAPKQKILTPAALPLFDLPADAEPRDRWLRTEELQALFAAAARLRRGDRLSRAERFLWLALETAARKEAILDLTWDRVDFTTGTIHYDVPGRKKTKKRRADVAISRNLRPVLERAYAERIGPRVLDGPGEVWAAIQLIAIEAGLGTLDRSSASAKPKATGISPHVLRHTAATHMARRGVPLFAIAKTLGNSIAMVEKVYAKWCPDSPETTVDLISGGLVELAE